MTPVNHVWVSSSYSNQDGGNCVQWAPAAAVVSGQVPVRDSKVPDGPALLMSASAWSAFVSSVKSN
ncbi:DUF397 domain-containing protein [Streptomyces sp. NPDC056638]|uniref:DUF397 domain-containing protein n=1 Tax=Streptomyces sp. NPDC056638 TaxID=3345887 RepID=UPI0036C2B022